MNTLLLCDIFEDRKGVLPNSRTKLYIEIVLFVLRRYENKNGLSSSGKDLLLVYKKELMILGRMALDSLRKGELYFEDDESDFKESLLGKFGFVSIQAGGSKRAPCRRYVFFHKSFQEFISAFFLAFSTIDGTRDCTLVANEEYVKDLSQVFKFMSGIVAMRSEATAVSIVKSFVTVVNVSGRISRDCETHPRLAMRFIDECKLFSETLNTDLAELFGKSLKLDDMDFRYDTSYWIMGSFSTLILALKVNTSVSSLDLSENSIGAEGANSLSQALRENNFLTSLNLSKNSIGDEGANSLSQALEENDFLTSLDLSFNSISDKGAKSLFQALKVNYSLTSLNLSDNSIGYEGAKSLSRVLRENTSLTSLNLSWNSISDKEASSLSQVLRRNTSPTLKLSFDRIEDEEANSLS